ncbi:OLD family endonuclease [Anaerolineae bacterium CFX9]|nr:OLD family endonuclease [Anaerolineae bacterium CFX9]
MNLTRFRVTNFRSIADTDWIDASRVTALIGTNESGKSNILLALWKLKPVRDGQIDLKADAPRKSYNQIRNMEQKPSFIQAEFELSASVIAQLTKMTGAAEEEVKLARVSRFLDGRHSVNFPNSKGQPTLPKASIAEVMTAAKAEIEQLDIAGKTEQPLKLAMQSSLDAAITTLEEEADDDITLDALTELQETLSQPDLSIGLKQSAIVPAYEQFLAQIQEFSAILSRPSPNSVKEARALVWQSIPSFVYYANYGNLDSEIYLPHVIANLARTDLGAHEAAKARTLRVLFEFVKLSPDEILELGKDVDANQNPTPDQIHEIAERKKEREILLQSASTELTKEFIDWWKQGNYQFRFQADGNHFRIWVRDEIRPEEIELEGRSTGLQWFLSFFLVFLVERSEAHKNAILLLDEPGVSLHPIAQEDLFKFFNNLSGTNQIFYTAHSPFMVDPDHLDRVRAVYFDEDGTDKGLTKVSADLRAKEKQQSEARSVYPVHAALGLAVSPVLLAGCQPVIVDGTSDQYYFSAIKNYLISRGHIKPERELLFLPSGSFKGIKAVVPIIAAKDQALPHIVLDSDTPGRTTETQLKGSLYTAEPARITMLSEICGFEEAEVEDLFPAEFIAYVVTRYLRGPEEEFSDVVISGSPLVPQIEAYAKKHNITLEQGWKVEVAKRVKERLLQRADSIDSETEVVQRWKQLFEKISA